MRKRTLAMAAIKSRITEARVELGLTSYHENIQRNLKAEDLTAVCVSEGVDEIIKRSARDRRGLPLSRKVMIIVDLVVNSTVVPDIREKLINLREVILVDTNPVVIDGAVDETTNEAVEEVAEIIFRKMR